MGLNFGENLFDKKNQYSDDGRLLSETGLEDAGRNKTAINRRGLTAAAAGITLYTVPANKVLFITGAWLQCLNDDVGSTAAATLDDASTIFFKVYCPKAIATYHPLRIEGLSITFRAPLKYAAATTIKLKSDTAIGTALGGFNGWLENA